MLLCIVYVPPSQTDVVDHLILRVVYQLDCDEWECRIVPMYVLINWIFMDATRVVHWSSSKVIGLIYQNRTFSSEIELQILSTKHLA